MTVGLRPRYSPVVQLVERWTVNPYVAGSSPARGANLRLSHYAITQAGLRLKMPCDSPVDDQILSSHVTGIVR